MLYKRIYSIHILLAIIIFTNGCGAGKFKSEAPTFKMNAALKAVADISSTERNIASNICLSLKSKSQNFKTSDFLGSRFLFQTKQSFCGAAVVSSNIVSTLALYNSDSSFHYTTSGSSYFNDFGQTDTSGYLSQVCTKINNNQAISNTLSLNGITVQITFFKDGLEGYAIQYFSNDKKGVSMLTSMEIFKFRTQVNYVVGNIMGMDEYYSKQYICPTDLTKSSIEEQSFTGRN